MKHSTEKRTGLRYLVLFSFIILFIMAGGLTYKTFEQKSQIETLKEIVNQTNDAHEAELTRIGEDLIRIRDDIETFVREVDFYTGRLKNLEEKLGPIEAIEYTGTNGRSLRFIASDE